MMVMSCCRTKLIYCFISDPIKKENEDSGACDKRNNDFMNGQRKMIEEEKESNSDVRKKQKVMG